MRKRRVVLAGASRAAYMRGDPAAAERHVRACLALGGDLDRWYAHTCLALVALTRGDFAAVVEYFAGTGNWSHLWTTLRNLARVLRAIARGLAPPAAGRSA
ncbi:hypothetical protein [Pseudonocardia sp.]|uniref:hypothetical protein n=1 Tax=Pseudonocardia sp. TaxID=60912 RepID=UPI003D0C3434